MRVDGGEHSDSRMEDTEKKARHADETGAGKERVTVIQKVKRHYTSPKVFLEILLSHSSTSLTKRDVESFGCRVALGN